MARLEPLVGERQKGETTRAVRACNDFLRMGPGRKMVRLWHRYLEMAESGEIEPPTVYHGTVRNWGWRHGWIARADAYDAAIDHEKTVRAEAIMHSGLALDYERVAELNALAAFLKAQVEELSPEGKRHRVYMPDVKQIGRGYDAERVDIERFNAPLISELRGVYDDLAKETGGRIKKAEVAGKGGGDIVIRVDLGDDDL